MPAPGRKEIGHNLWAYQVWTVEDWHGNAVVDRIFTSYDSAKRAMERYLAVPGRDEDVRIVADVIVDDQPR